MSNDYNAGIALVPRSNINNPSISCTVSHTISTVKQKNTMAIVDILKIVCFISFSLMCVIGSIAACMTSHIISPYVPQAPQGSVDGSWSDWNSWSQCSITCSNEDTPFGNMTRVRYCNSPPPQYNGKLCDGVAFQTTECFRNTCPIPVDGNWAEWSAWSTCSATCQSSVFIPRQIRSSTCSDPAPKDGGRPCDGESNQERFCSWLIQCPVDGQWGEWHVAGACESVNRKSCALGKKLYQRQCNKPLPSGSGKDCQGLKEKNEDCWFDIGCPVGLQAPLNVQVLGNGSGLFEIRWHSVPYGITAKLYRLYLAIQDKNMSQVDTVRINVSATPSKDVSGTTYSISTDLRRYLMSGKFVTLEVRMSSIDVWGTESPLSSAVKSKANEVDGQWGEWDHWSECSTQCVNSRGSRYRRRKCDNPPPTTGGKPCLDVSEEEAPCIGMETEC